MKTLNSVQNRKKTFFRVDFDCPCLVAEREKERETERETERKSERVIS